MSTLTVKRMSKAVIIGAGAAGMMAGIAASSNGHKTVVFEKNEKPGKKIYITGKGRCNITNDCEVEDLLKNVVSNPKFLYSAFYSFTSRDMMAFLEAEGLKLKVERGGRVFPESDKSSDVIAILRKALVKRHADLRLNTPVKRLICSEGKVDGVELMDGTIEKSDAVIVATGGLSYPSTGSTGDGYYMAKACGHTVNATSPSLVPLNIAEDWYEALQGLSLKNICLTIKSGKKKLYEDFGEMLFTHFGISGPLILSASACCNKAIADGEAAASIDLKPALSVEQLDARILKDFEKYKNKQFRNALSDLLPSKLIPVFIDRSGIDPFKQVNAISRRERERIIDLIKHFDMHITGLRGYSEAVITKGGISTRQVNPATMESKLIKGLYFAGEVLDVDAQTGGFNLQIAWSTGWLAGMSL